MKTFLNWLCWWWHQRSPRKSFSVHPRQKNFNFCFHMWSPPQPNAASSLIYCGFVQVDHLACLNASYINWQACFCLKCPHISRHRPKFSTECGAFKLMKCRLKQFRKIESIFVWIPNLSPLALESCRNPAVPPVPLINCAGPFDQISPHRSIFKCL